MQIQGQIVDIKNKCISDVFVCGFEGLKRHEAKGMRQ